ncbi:hypothetical protein BUC_5015 [Burkholderia pseudomallei 576]|nr:hypothetical protein BUC_5015 [Burkholderia pseudomallei 576]
MQRTDSRKRTRRPARRRLLDARPHHAATKNAQARPPSPQPGGAAARRESQAWPRGMDREDGADRQP